VTVAANQWVVLDVTELKVKKLKVEGVLEIAPIAKTPGSRRRRASEEVNFKTM
jgi:hypothetical protein